MYEKRCYVYIMYIYVYTYTCIQAGLCMRACIHVCTCICKFVAFRYVSCLYVLTYPYIYQYKVSVRMYVFYIHAFYMHACVCVCVCLDMTSVNQALIRTYNAPYFPDEISCLCPFLITNMSERQGPCLSSGGYTHISYCRTSNSDPA